MKIVLIALVCSLLGCGLDCLNIACEACPPAVSVVATDARTGEPVAGLSLNPNAQCSSDGPTTQCNVSGAAGTFDLVASAPGYADQSFHVVVPEDDPVAGACCSCGYVGQAVTITLDPL